MNVPDHPDAENDDGSLVPFPLHYLPPAAEDMANAVCAATGVPASLAGPVALGLLSAAVGAGLEVESGPGRTARANLYVLISAESGAGKSETMRPLAAPLYAAAATREDEWHRNILPGAKAEAEILDAEITLLRRGVEKTDDAAARAELCAKLAEKKAASAACEAKLQPPRICVEDVTTEKLAVLLARNGEMLTSLSSDAGAVAQNLLGRYNGARNRPDESLYLKAWTGEPFTADRIGRDGVSLRRPCMSVLWLLQPCKVEELLAEPTLAGAGFLPRLLVCHSRARPREIDPDAAPLSVPEEIAAAWEQRINTLLATFHAAAAPQVIAPTREARRVLLGYANAITRRHLNGELDGAEAFAARWAEQAWRIALCLHAGLYSAEAGGRPLDEYVAAAAVRIAEWFEREQTALLSAGRAVRRAERLKRFCLVLSSQPRAAATLRDLHNNHGFEPAEVRRLVAGAPGQISLETRPAGPKGGRPSEIARLTTP